MGQGTCSTGATLFSTQNMSSHFYNNHNYRTSASHHTIHLNVQCSNYAMHIVKARTGMCISTQNYKMLMESQTTQKHIDMSIKHFAKLNSLFLRPLPLMEKKGLVSWVCKWSHVLRSVTAYISRTNLRVLTGKNGSVSDSINYSARTKPAL